MKFLFDFFPTIVFFIVYKFFGFFPATYAIIVASVIQVALNWLKTRKIEPMHIILLALVLVFGGLTIYFHDAEFLMWKVSIVNWLLGAVMIASHFFKTNILEYIFSYSARQQQQELNIPAYLTTRLNIAWGIFFLILGTINIIIAHTFSLNAWVDFKVFGILGLTIVFAFGQGFYLMKHMKE